MTPFYTLRYIIQHPANSNQKFQSVIRYFYWQIYSRIFRPKKVIKYVGKTKFNVRRGHYAGTAALYVGLCDFEEMALVLHALRSGDLFVDVGALEGTWTIIAAGACKANVVALEPTPESFELLKDNIRINGLEDKVEALAIAAGDENGSASLLLDNGSTNRILREKSDNSNHMVEVPIRKLDSVLSNRWPNIMKIDVEGFESAVLEGAQQSLQNSSLKILIIETIGIGKVYGFDDQAIHVSLLKHGFQIVNYDPVNRKLTLNGAKSVDSNNTIYARDIDFIQQRIESSEYYSIHGMTL